MVDSGTGESQLNTLLSALGIPSLDFKLLKRYERIVGKAIEQCALESCKKSIEEERMATILHEKEYIIHFCSI